MPLISVVIPVYRAEAYVEELGKRLVASLGTMTEDFEIILVEDGSRDRSWRLIQELAKTDSRVKGIRFSRNFGQHPAIAAGFRESRGDLIVLMDCDLQDRPEDIPKLVETQRQTGADIVYTIKEGETGSWHVNLTSRLYHYVFSKVAGLSVPENIGTFRLCTRNFLNAVLEYPERNILFGPLMFYVGFESAIIEVRHEKRSVGKSTYTFRKRLALAVNSLVSYTDLPMRALLWFGSVTTGLSLLYGIVIILGYFVFGRALAAGITLIVLLLLTSTGIIMASLGIIGSYVFRVYQEVLRRPRYNVSQTINL